MDCGIEGTRSWEGPIRRYLKKEDLRNNWCPWCQEGWEKEMWDISRAKRITRQCWTCSKDDSLPTKEWSPEIQGRVCGLCVEDEKKIAEIEKELKVLRMREVA